MPTVKHLKHVYGWISHWDVDIFQRKNIKNHTLYYEEIGRILGHMASHPEKFKPKDYSKLH
ncbi:hypothetical protein BH11BAC7_BH11BAC7_30280 [soil metagenome]